MRRLPLTLALLLAAAAACSAASSALFTDLKPIVLDLPDRNPLHNDSRAESVRPPDGHICKAMTAKWLSTAQRPGPAITPSS